MATKRTYSKRKDAVAEPSSTPYDWLAKEDSKKTREDSSRFERLSMGDLHRLDLQFDVHDDPRVCEQAVVTDRQYIDKVTVEFEKARAQQKKVATTKKATADELVFEPGHKHDSDLQIPVGTGMIRGRAFESKRILSIEECLATVPPSDSTTIESVYRLLGESPLEKVLMVDGGKLLLALVPFDRNNHAYFVALEFPLLDSKEQPEPVKKLLLQATGSKSGVTQASLKAMHQTAKVRWEGSFYFFACQCAQ
jgi:hypothetical protein